MLNLRYLPEEEEYRVSGIFTGLILESHQEKEVVSDCARYLGDVSTVGPSLLLLE